MNRIGDKGAARVQHSPGTSLNHCQQYSASSHGSWLEMANYGTDIPYSQTTHQRMLWGMRWNAFCKSTKHLVDWLGKLQCIHEYIWDDRAGPVFHKGGKKNVSLDFKVWLTHRLSSPVPLCRSFKGGWGVWSSYNWSTPSGVLNDGNHHLSLPIWRHCPKSTHAIAEACQPV